MSLATLLTVGRSLTGIKSQPSSYRMAAEHALPVFQPSVPRFRSGAGGKKVPAVTGSLFPEPALSGAAPAPAIPIQTAMPTLAEDQAAAASVVQKNDEAVAAGLSSAESRRWWRILRFRKRKQGERRMVQAEFSLDRLRVVRNDLFDADIEVVPAAKEPLCPPEARRQVLRPSNGMIWSRLAARLSVAGRTDSSANG